MKEEDEPEEEEEDELGHAETYAEYMPMKCEYKCWVSGMNCTFLALKMQRYRAEYFALWSCETTARLKTAHPQINQKTFLLLFVVWSTDRSVCHCSKDRPAASWSCGGDQLPVQCQSSRGVVQTVHPRGGHRPGLPVCSAARSHHIRSSGQQCVNAGNRKYDEKYELTPFFTTKNRLKQNFKSFFFFCQKTNATDKWKNVLFSVIMQSLIQ